MRHASRLHHIGLGRRHAETRVLVLEESFGTIALGHVNIGMAATTTS